MKRHSEAISEVLIVSIFSLIPLLVLPFVDLRSHPEKLSAATLMLAINRGQLFLYSFGVFGMLVWLLGSSRRIIPSAAFFVILMLTLIPGFICFIMISDDPEFTSNLDPQLVNLSIGLYVLYLIVYYVLLIF